MVTMLSQKHSVNIHPPPFYYKTILTSSSQWHILPSYAHLFSPMHTICSAYLTVPDLITLITVYIATLIQHLHACMVQTISFSLIPHVVMQGTVYNQSNVLFVVVFCVDSNSHSADLFSEQQVPAACGYGHKSLHPRHLPILPSGSLYSLLSKIFGKLNWHQAEQRLGL
jgi:hypothetical protein